MENFLFNHHLNFQLDDEWRVQMNRRTNDSLVCSWVITLELLIHMIQDITRYNVIYCFLWRKSLNSLMFCILYWKTLAISDSVCRKGSERGNVVCIWSDMRKRNGPRTVVISKMTCLLFVIVYVLQTKIKVEVSTRISRKKNWSTYGKMTFVPSNSFYQN